MNSKILVVIIFLLFALLSGCDLDYYCNRGEYPEPPLGNPDDWHEYHDGEGYQSVTYTYFCHEEQYKAFTYVSHNSCDEWELDSEYFSSCKDF